MTIYDFVLFIINPPVRLLLFSLFNLWRQYMFFCLQQGRNTFIAPFHILLFYLSFNCRRCKMPFSEKPDFLDSAPGEPKLISVKVMVLFDLEYLQLREVGGESDSLVYA